MKIDQPETGYYPSSSKIQSTEFALTLLPDARLSRRLLTEVTFVFRQIKNSWPKFKEDPFGSIGRVASHLAAAANRTIGRPQTAFALATSILILGSVIVVVLLLERHQDARIVDGESEFGEVTILKSESSSQTQEGRGVGAGEKGRVGLERGRGEGSRPTPARAQGGGGGGTHSRLAASRGRPPVPSIIPAPIPTAAVRLPQALPVAGIDLDPALWRKLDYSTYGDPRSKEVMPSNGPGSGGGVGNGNGLGI